MNRLLTLKNAIKIDTEERPMPPNRAVTRQPNVVFILADDVGWADVPWNNRNLRYLKTL
jgi:hypothetical protein